MSQITDTASDQDDFWLPDLCNALALLRLILLGVFIAITLTLLRQGVQGFELTSIGRLFLYDVWIVFLAVAGLCQLRKWGRRLPVSYSVCIAIFWLIASASICALAAFQFGLQVYADDAVTLFSLWSETTLITLIIGSLALRFLYVHHELKRQQQRLMQAQYDALQARIRPHFLFNSLNSIATLIAIDARRAEDAILNLSDLLRATLGEKDSHSLADELKICSRYLDIEALRMGERMRVQMDVEPQLNTMPVPSLFLQPLLENAVLHGLQQLPEGGTIQLRARRSQNSPDQVCIQIENPVPAMPTASKGSQSALVNVQSRLNQFYQGTSLLNTSEENGIFKVRIEIPWAHD